MVPLLVPGCRKMFTSVGDPFLFPEFFHQLVFPCRHTCSSETRGTIPTSLLVFVGNVFTPLVSLLFLECKLHCGTCSLALKARAEAVLTTILYMPFDVVYYLFLCVLLLLRQLGLLSMEWYPSLILKFFHQLFFHAGTCVLWRHLAPSLHLYLFCGKHFYFPCYFLWSASCTLAI